MTEMTSCGRIFQYLMQNERVASSFPLDARVVSMIVY